MARSRAAASFDRCSWMKAVVIASTTIVAITTAARTSPRKYETTAKRQQQGVQRIARTAPELLGDGGLAFARDEIGPELLQACLRLGVGQAFRCGLQFRAGFEGLKPADFHEQPIMGGGLRAHAFGLLDRFREHIHERVRKV